MERRTLIMITAGAILIVLLAGVGIYLLRTRDVGGGQAPRPGIGGPSSNPSSTIPMPTQDAIQAQRDAYASSTYDERLKQLPPEVQQQLQQTPSSVRSLAPPTASSAATTTASPGRPDPSADPDGDGLTNLQEEQLGTNPNNPDSDGDGLTDGQEVNVYKSNPLNPDTDGDGYKDGDEVKAGYNPNGPGKLSL
ncbi:MAG TPA: hypothetical protein VMU11_01585 [Verrucomicrobiae bacterium]|nr:hypothetical protein [Verrucomicrobiae bacterium]